MRKVFVLLAAALVVSIVLSAQVGSAAAAGAARVTSASDSGPGSFRAAVGLANADSSVGSIVFVGNLEPIALTEPVVYTGSQSLGIVGNGAVLVGEGFRAETGGDLAVIGLTVRDAPGEGLAYELPASASGTKQVSLNGVTVSGNDGHGVLIDDQVDPEDTSNPNGSDASLDVSVNNTTFDGNGFGALDRDGLRVNEGGAGTLTVVVRNTLATENGADGIELDERGAGDVAFTVSGAEITENGSFDVTEVDLDDGMDVDESGSGSLIGRVATSVASDNFEEGWDFNENDAGDLRVEMTNVAANGNREEGVDLEEDDGFEDTGNGSGDLVANLINVTADGNLGGNAGLKIREYSAGNVVAFLRGAQANDNTTAGILVREENDGSVQASIERATAVGNTSTGIRVREDSTGNLAATVDGSTARDNGADGIEFDENSSGDLTAEVSRSDSSDNAGYGVRADQALPGAGALVLRATTLTGNGGALNEGAFFGSNVTVTQA